MINQRFIGFVKSIRYLAGPTTKFSLRQRANRVLCLWSK